MKKIITRQHNLINNTAATCINKTKYIKMQTLRKLNFLKKKSSDILIKKIKM